MSHKPATPETRSVRLLKVGEQVRHVISELLMRDKVHDDVLTAHSVSVTEVRMSPDLRHATVFVKPLLGSDEEIVLKALRTHTAFFREKSRASCVPNMPRGSRFCPTRALTRPAGSTPCSATPRSSGIWRTANNIRVY